MEAASCWCSDYDSDGPKVFEEFYVRRSRKPHTCCECREPIAIGSTYVCTEGLWDGSWSRYRTCVVCNRIREDYCAAPYGQLWPYLESALGTDYVTGEDTRESRERLSIRRHVSHQRQVLGLDVTMSDGRLA